jgi:hypothetical protein
MLKLFVNYNAKDTKYMTLKFLFAGLFLVLAFNQSAFAQTKAPAGSVIFWAELRKLCGKAYAGTLASAPENDADFKGKELVMHVRGCEKNRIRIPFFVGANKSRTWVLSEKNERILLKHDHRHEDGTPDKITMYGGWTTSGGAPTRQMFSADQQTVDVLPAAASNVWWIELVPGESFTYNLRRMGTERFFSIKFDLREEVKTPDAPWGWKN